MAQHLAAQVLSPRLAVGEQSLAGGDHGHAHAAEHARHAVGPGVNAQAGLGHALDARDGAAASEEARLTGTDAGEEAADDGTA